MTRTTIANALISVSDKTGIAPFARTLHDMGVRIISTGGTAALLEKEGIPVTPVSQVTGAPEMMDGRVKTLNPIIHGGILARRDTDDHLKAMETHHIPGIDLVVVNLYPFGAVLTRQDADRDELVENIDIGGPAMIRAAAKNHDFVTVVTDAGAYETVLMSCKPEVLLLQPGVASPHRPMPIPPAMMPPSPPGCVPMVMTTPCRHLSPWAVCEERPCVMVKTRIRTPHFTTCRNARLGPEC